MPASVRRARRPRRRGCRAGRGLRCRARGSSKRRGCAPPRERIMGPPAECSQKDLNHSRWALAAALVTMFFWGVNFAFVKYVLDALGVGPFLFIRFTAMPVLCAGLLLLVFR